MSEFLRRANRQFRIEAMRFKVFDTGAAAHFLDAEGKILP